MSKKVTQPKVTEAMLRDYLRGELRAGDSEAIAEIVRNSFFFSKVAEVISAELNAEKEAAKKPDLQEGFLNQATKSFFRKVKKLSHQCQVCFGVEKPELFPLAI